jgi:hypothetical protein
MFNHVVSFIYNPEVKRWGHLLRIGFADSVVFDGSTYAFGMFSCITIGIIIFFQHFSYVVSAFAINTAPSTEEDTGTLFSSNPSINMAYLSSLGI